MDTVDDPFTVWDLRDVRINLTAGALMQVAIFGAFRPSIVSGWPPRKNIRRLLLLAAFGLFVLFLSYMNTPERVVGYTKRLTFLSFLLDGESMMVEYGHLYDDPEIGIFRSRFALKELRKKNRWRGQAVAKILDEYINEDDYDRFQIIYSVPRDAYAHEAGVHLFRRNRRLKGCLVTRNKAIYSLQLCAARKSHSGKILSLGVDKLETCIAT